MNNILKTSVLNINGIGRGSTQKVQWIKTDIKSNHVPILFLQETKTKALPVSFKTLFPETIFRTYFCNKGQGAAIVVNKLLLPESQFEFDFSQTCSSSHILQTLKITDHHKSHPQTSRPSLSLSNVYQSPSLPLSQILLDAIDTAAPDAILGDINETAHRAALQSWHTSPQSKYTSNLIQFPTFQNHISKQLTTTPDCVYATPDCLPTLQVLNSNKVYSDHIRVDVNFSTPFILPGPPPRTKTINFYDFDAVVVQRDLIWSRLSPGSCLARVKTSLFEIKDLARRRKTVTSEYYQGDPKPGNTPVEANAAIDSHWKVLTHKVNVERELGKVWSFIKKHQHVPTSSPAHVKIARNRSRIAFNELRVKCSRDGNHELIQGVQKDRWLKAQRILREYHKYAKNLPYSSKAFTLAELQTVLADINTASSPGPDLTSWSAFPPISHGAWGVILNAINVQLFKKTPHKLPTWLKQARLVQAEKNDGSGKLRPISIVNFLSCIIDKLYVSKFNILISRDPALKNRFGFIPDRSCEDVVGLLLSDIESDKLRNFKSCLLQFDLSAAYDLVSFVNIVIAMDDFLKRNGEHEKCPHLLLFSFYWAKNREIHFENTVFSPSNGLPQGAPLSCPVFVIVFNYNPPTPLSAQVNMSSFYFADDNSVYLSGPTLPLVKAAALHVISDFEKWCAENHMKLNVDKSKILWFTPTDPVLDSPVKTALHVRVLGVHFDKKLNFEHHVSQLVEYCKRYRPPLRYLTYLGLNDNLARQFVLGCRNKLTYGLYWLAKIPKTRFELLEKWWTNLQRAWLGARNRISRNLVFEASGLPKIRNFSSYLLLKRAFFWGRKNLPTRPTFSIHDTVHKSKTSIPRRKVSPRHSTKAVTAEADYQHFLRQTNSASAWLGEILTENPTLSSFLSADPPPKWEDSRVRTELGAKSVHHSLLWSKAERRQIFADAYPAYN